MSFNTTLRTNIIFSHKTYDEKCKVEEDLEDAKQYRQGVIWDLVRKNTELDRFELRELTEELEESDVQIWKLEQLLSDWDNLDRDNLGRFVDIDYEEKPKLCGDFINVKSVEDLE